MKKGYKKLLIICLILTVLLTLNITFNILDKKFYILFLLIIFSSLVFLIGLEEDKFIYKKDIILIITMSCLFYWIITYALGFFIGFIKNGYKLSFSNITNNLISFFIIVILEELIRYNLVKKGSRNINVLILVVVITILMDITLTIKGFDLKSDYLLIIFFLNQFLPSLFKNSMLTYATYKGGYKASIIYRIILESPIYFMPLFPNLGIYIESIFKILFPTLLWFILYKMLSYNERMTTNKVDKNNKVWNIFIIVFITITIVLNSGWFKYYTLTIGSGSMSPNINKGDVIIVKKLDKNELSKITIGEVLVFKKGDKILVHRIVDLKIINNTYYFYTKGDANNDIDRFITEEKDILGTTNNRIMFVGYPTVWLSEVMNKK